MCNRQTFILATRPKSLLNFKYVWTWPPGGSVLSVFGVRNAKLCLQDHVLKTQGLADVSETV